jgi:predicted dehydrogenase
MWGVDEDSSFTSIEEAVQFGEGPYDLAIICTPIYTHHVLALEAMELGLNVMIEKNLASTIDQGRMLVKAATAHPELCTAVGNQTRYFPKNWTMKKYYLENKQKFGDITSLYVTYLANWGKTRHGWRRWLADLFLEDMAPHQFDYIRYLTGMDVVQVQGINFRPKFSNFKGSSSTLAIMALAKPENYHNPDEWIYVDYRGDWQKKGETYEKYEMLCEKGDIQLLNKDVSAHIYTDEEGLKWTTENVPLADDVENNENKYSDLMLILEQFSKGIDSKGQLQPGTNIKDSIKSFSISMGIRESFQTKQAVFLPKYWENLSL